MTSWLRRERWLRTVAVALGLGALLGCPPSPAKGPLLHVPSPSWEEQVIYFVLTDRFANGDPRNDDQGQGEFDPSDKDKYSGGDLQGLIDRLDYIQGMGMTAVWITPPVANMWWDPLQLSGGYHGYWARHLKKVDEHLGTLETYQALSDALHRRGMYLIQDIVPNHMGNFFTYSHCTASACQSLYDAACVPDAQAAGCDVTKGYLPNTAAVPSGKPEQAPFDANDPTDPAQRARGIYHWTPAITDYGDAHQQWYWQISDLDDLDSESAEVRAALKDSYGWWISQVGVDGFRVDTAKFAPHDFWNDFFHSSDASAPGIMAVAKSTGRAHFLAFGEVLETSGALDDSAEKKLLPYFGTAAAPEFESLLAYPLWAEVGSVIAQGRPTANLTYRLAKFLDPSLNPNPARSPIFIDNHDQSRFAAIGTGDALVQAVVLLFTIPGIPTVYYGTEQGLAVTRQAMFDGGWSASGDSFNTGIGLYRIIKDLAALRKQHPVLTHGTLTVLVDSAAGAGPFVFRRALEGDTALVLMNTSNKQVLLSEMDTGLAAGATLENWHTEPLAYSFDPPKVGSGGRITLALSARAVIVAHATGQVEAVNAPEATITVATPLEGETFTADVTITGTVSPATAKLKMVLDASLGDAKAVAVESDGSWSITLPVSQFPVGLQHHGLAFYAPDANVSTAVAHFNSDVAFNGRIVTVADPEGDDHGPPGHAYRYPTDGSFSRQQDLVEVKALVGAATMKLQLTLGNMTNVWSPDLGFDHVVFNLYFELPRQTGGSTVLPFLSAQAPAGFSWTFGQFSSGFSGDNKMFTSAGADATHFGAPTTGPGIVANAVTKTVTFEYDRNNFGLSSWNGVRVYVTTWDYDGVLKVFRPISQAGGPYVYGNGAAEDPHIMDDVPPITLEAP